jgi:ketosteroid isomerase-like protein
MRRLLAAVAFAAMAAASAAHAQDPDALRDTIVAQDRALFDAYNACDIDTFRDHLAEDIEFYQDNDDVTTSRDALEASFRQHCGPGGVAKQRRELVPGTLEVHPIQGYGAVEIGAHRFCEVVPNGKAPQCATPRFVHLWHDDDGHWRITRVISYGH